MKGSWSDTHRVSDDTLLADLIISNQNFPLKFFLNIIHFIKLKKMIRLVTKSKNL